MFVSEYLEKKVVIPQNEHARLAGHIASFWGNENFDKPNIEFNSLVKGISYHQSGFGQFDTVEIGAIKEAEYYDIYMGDATADLADPVAELVNLFHQQRLAKKQLVVTKYEVFQKIKKEIDNLIEEKLKNVPFTKEDFTWANRITHLCDKLAFNFSFGVKKEESIEVFPSVEKFEALDIKQQVIADRSIVVDPWPFRVKKIESVVYAYDQKGYPEVLIPNILFANIHSRDSNKEIDES